MSKLKILPSLQFGQDYSSRCMVIQIEIPFLFLKNVHYVHSVEAYSIQVIFVATAFESRSDIGIIFPAASSPSTILILFV